MFTNVLFKVLNTVLMENQRLTVQCQRVNRRNTILMVKRLDTKQQHRHLKKMAKSQHIQFTHNSKEFFVFVICPQHNFLLT